MGGEIFAVMKCVMRRRLTLTDRQRECDRISRVTEETTGGLNPESKTAELSLGLFTLSSDSTVSTRGAAIGQIPSDLTLLSSEDIFRLIQNQKQMFLVTAQTLTSLDV